MSNGTFFEDLYVGQAASLSKTITDADILMYAAVSLDTNPIHIDEEDRPGLSLRRTRRAWHADGWPDFPRCWGRACLDRGRSTVVSR